MDEGFHGAWANSKALQMLGIDKNTLDPEPGFSYYKRDKKGNPTGYLLEGTATKGIEKFDIININAVAAGTGDVIDIMNSYGITAVFDAGASDVDALQLKVLDKISQQGEMTVRMVASHMIGTSEAAEKAISIVEHKRAISKHDMYHINTLKIMNDGTIEGKTAGMFEDYQGEPGNKGITVFSQKQMNKLIAQASEKNIDVHIHALGERAISETLNAIELVRNNTKYNHSTSRYAICHIQVMTDNDVKRFARLNVIAQSTPLWASYDEFGKAFVSDDQFNRYFRYNSLKQAGVRMSFGSDFPATGAGTLGMSPIFNIEIGHTRQMPDQKNAPIQPNINERLDIASLIKGYTLNAAYQMHMEEEIGSIEVGKKADFVLLDKNLFKVEKYQLHKVKVLQTILAGNTVYSAPK
jgi:predicted amidohydrolase YtcJ